MLHHQGQTPYIIDSVFTVLDKLHEVIAEVCQDNYVGLCSNFHSSLNISEQLANKLYNTGQTANGFEIRNGISMANLNIYYRNQNSYVRVSWNYLK